LDRFWKGTTIDKDLLQIDLVTLTAIFIYILSRMKNFPEIIVHLSLIKSFLPEAAEICHRALYINVLEGAKDYIIQKHPSNNPNYMEQTQGVNQNDTTYD